MQLHSCSVETLEQGDVIEALLKARDAGKTRFVGYSGDNEAAMWAVESGIFETLQTSFSLVDQQARNGLFAAAEAQGMGVIIKRPIGNGVWGRAEASSPYATAVLRAPPGHVGSLAQWMARTTPSAWQWASPSGTREVDTAIVGTTNLRHLQSNAAMLDEGIDLPVGTMETLVQRFSQLGADWTQKT